MSKKPILALIAIAALFASATHATACELRYEPSQTFGGSCQVLVGYYNGQRVGPFHISVPDGSHITAGSCDGFVHVTGVSGNVVDLDAFHSFPASQYTLGLDCRNAVKTR